MPPNSHSTFLPDHFPKIVRTVAAEEISIFRSVLEHIEFRETKNTFYRWTARLCPKCFLTLFSFSQVLLGPHFRRQTVLITTTTAQVSSSCEWVSGSTKTWNWTENIFNRRLLCCCYRKRDDALLSSKQVWVNVNSSCRVVIFFLLLFFAFIW